MADHRRRAAKKSQNAQVVKKKRTEPVSAKLKRMYYKISDPGSFGSIEKLKSRLPKSQRDSVVPWLQSQDVYTTFHKKRRNFPVNFNMAMESDHCWEVDLAIMEKFAEDNNNVKYLLFCIDMFDKFLWVEPMKHKTGEACLAAFKKILERAHPRICRFLRSDLGREFDNSLLKKFIATKGITWQMAGNWSKAGSVERTIRTIKDKLWKIFYYRGTFKYIDILQDVISSYNHAQHSRLGHAPADVHERDAFDIWSRHYKRHVSGPTPKPKFAVGEHVRLLINRKGSYKDRGYLQGFTDEIFQIYRVQTKHQTGYLAQPVFHVRDLRGEPILGGWVADELTPVVFDPQKKSFRIREVLDTRINPQTKRKEHLVSFWGYPKEFNDWVEARGVKNL